ncbi:hypothetical protein HanLR1_Chr09g0327841 [Helianthus annuus]|nr:hypothetical protein HanHA89_Chr09g0348501 [Helianthus annuus]KAJ0708288.1 hypothetical protein HanLR1_Chr09g0327841 [Helianthus annuus]
MLACHRSAVERRRRTKGGSIFQPDFTWVLSSVAFEAAPTSNFISNW